MELHWRLCSACIQFLWYFFLVNLFIIISLFIAVTYFASRVASVVRMWRSHFLTIYQTLRVNDIEYQCKFCTAKAKVCVWVSTALCSMVVSPLVVVSSAPWAMFCLCLDNCFLSQTCNRQTIKIRSPICQLVVQGAKQTTKNPFSLVFFLVHKM